MKDISADCEIHTFDHTVGNNPSNLPRQGSVTFHPWALAAKNYGNNKTLPTIIKELGHEGREIDIFKIDCEGCELSTYETWFDGTDSTTIIRQIQLEVHGGTKGTTPVAMQRLMLFLQKRGYVIFHKEPNIQFGGGKCVEYAFLRLNLKKTEMPLEGI